MAPVASLLESIYIAVFGMTVVFIVLIGLNLIIRLQTGIYTQITNRKKSTTNAIKDTEEAVASLPTIADEKLKLINVDEKTAAFVMAIVCDELKIAPEELYFKSIKGLDPIEEQQ